MKLLKKNLKEANYFNLKKELQIALKNIKQEKLILYPTDTVWGIGCDATNFNAVQKIYKLKKREENISMICLVSDIEMLSQYIDEIPDAAISILQYSVKPTTIVYDKPKNTASNLIAKDNTLAIRVVKDGFVHKLIKAFGKPIVSTSANISGQSTPKSFKEINEEIIKGVDYVVNLPDEKKDKKPSSIIKLSNDGQVKILRE